MKTKLTFLPACIIMVIMFTGYHAQAQQTENVKPLTAAGQVPGKETVTGYTYKVFQAPNKMYGYDIFLDGKIVFHQGASVSQPTKQFAWLTKKEHADAAALLAIEKIKKNQPATLTQEEIKKITNK